MNTDGTSKGNPGLSTYEFCLRNESGNMIYEKPGQLGVATSNVEALAILRALRHCKAQGWDRVILETDSLSLQKINTKEWGIPWEIVQLVNKIQSIIEHINIKTIHIFREANSLKDYIANIVKLGETM